MSVVRRTLPQSVELFEEALRGVPFRSVREDEQHVGADDGVLGQLGVVFVGRWSIESRRVDDPDVVQHRCG